MAFRPRGGVGRLRANRKGATGFVSAKRRKAAEHRWTEPVAFARVTAGRWSGWPEPANVEQEARKIRRANEIEAEAGRPCWPDTDWVYEPILRPPPKPA